jgi:hypothetical protein
MSGQLFTKWFWPDWLSDQGLRACSEGARGVWMDMLCVAAQNDPYGYVGIKGQPLTPAAFARITGVASNHLRTLVAELEVHGVFSRDRAGNIYCRRMVREAKATERDRSNGRKGGNPALRGDYNEPGYVYLAGPRSTDNWYKVGASRDPVRRVQKIRGGLKDASIVLIGAVQTDDMGALEKQWHDKLGRLLGRPEHVGEWFPLNPQALEELRRKFPPLKGRPGGAHPPNGSKPLATSHRDSSVEESLMSEPNGSAIGAEGAFEAYNARAEELGLPIAKALSEKRRKQIRTRLKENPGTWPDAILALGAPFLTGQNDKGWRADLDFVLQPKSYLRLIEGFYRNLHDDHRSKAQLAGDARRENLARAFNAPDLSDSGRRG